MTSKCITNGYKIDHLRNILSRRKYQQMISQHRHQVTANDSADCCCEEDRRTDKRKRILSLVGRQERERRLGRTEKSIYYYPSTTFIISIFLFQLVQHVYSWSSSSSLSSSLNRPLDASISSTSTTTTIKNSFVRGDSLLSTTSASLRSSDHYYHHRYRMSSSLMLIQRHEKLPRRGKNVRIPSTDIKLSQSFRQHQQQLLLQARYKYRLPTNNIQQQNTNTNNPFMLLGDDLFFSMSNSNSAAATTTPSSSSSSRNLSSSSSLSSWKSIINGGQKKNLLGKNQNQNQQRVKEREQRRGVLGFDLIESQSTSQRGTSSSSSSSNESESYATTTTASPLLPLPEPVLFPLIPTKSQIMSLKLKELKEACSQRGLIKSGNKDIIQERLLRWTTTEHQIQQEQQQNNEAKINNGNDVDYITSWFEDSTTNNNPHSILRRRRQQKLEVDIDSEVEVDEEDKNYNTRNKNPDQDDSIPFEEITPNDTATTTTTSTFNSNNTPNSLAEWTRLVDSEKLTQKRQEIHRQKRIGKKPPTTNIDTDIETDTDTNNENLLYSKNNKYNNRNKNKKETIAATKEYLLKLTNAMKTTSSSSPYAASNKEVKELYDASKKADQLGEPLLAIQLLESLLQVTPNDARVIRRLSRMQREQGNLDGARSTLQNGIRKLPKNPWLWHGLGQFELSYGDTDVGIKCYQRAIKEDVTFAHSYHAWGVYEFSNGQIAKAMKIFKRGIEYCPTNHRLHHALGDLYRGAKLLKNAEQSYRRSLEEGPPISHSFAFSALAGVAYEQHDVDEARRWLYKSIETNNGRHAQGWLALAQIEEAEGNFQKALTVCEASIVRYEKGLVEARQRYTKAKYNNVDRRRGNQDGISSNSSDGRRPGKKGNEQQFDVNKFPKDPTTLKIIEEGLLKSVPKYRSGDKFLGVYRHWARLEGRYGTFDNMNRVYERASAAFPYDYKISLDWARYHSKHHHVEEARSLFTEACNRASRSHNADPYREYASFEMDLGHFEQARNILFLGARRLTRLSSSDGGRQSGSSCSSSSSSSSSSNNNNRGRLAQLYVTWAVCEWHLKNIPRAEFLFDHALRLTSVKGDKGSELRSFILFCMARLEYYERQEIHLAQHCIGLCLKENALPGDDNNAPVWKLWAKIAHDMHIPDLESQCLFEATKCKITMNNRKEGEGSSSALETMKMLKGSQKMKNWMRQEPWHDKLQIVRGGRNGFRGGNRGGSSESDFYSTIHIPVPNYDETM